MPPVSRPILILAAAMLLLVAVLGVLGGAPVTIAETPANETPVHQHPDEYDEDGDLGPLENWLSSDLSDRLEESAIALSDGEYDLAKSMIDEEYHERLAQYATVTGETTTESPDPENDTVQTYEAAAEEQETVANATEQYYERLDAYQQAVEAGDEETAREIARELEALAETIGITAGNLTERYERLTSLTGTDLTEAATATESTRATIGSVQATVRDEQFEATTLVVEPDDDEISFREPLRATAYVVDETGDRLPAAAIGLAVDGTDIEVDERAGTEVSFTYRPTTQPQGDTNLTVTYQPDPTSPYLGDHTRVPVEIEQVEPSMTTEIDDTIGFEQPATVTGTVSVDEDPVAGLPVEVRVDGEVVDEFITTDTGTLEESVTVPASVPTGEQPVTMAFPVTDRAIAPTTADATVTVTETPTTLTLERERLEGDTVTVTATLETAGETPIEGADIDLDAGTDERYTATTGADGSATVGIPVSGDDEVIVTATYQDSSTNLANTSVSQSVRDAEPTDAWLSLPVSPWLLLGVSGGLLALVTLGFVLRRGAQSDEPRVTDAPTERTVVDDESRNLSATLLEVAQERLDAEETDATVTTAYGAVRAEHGTPDEEQAALTHWEFLERHRSGPLADENRAALERLTEHFERAEYAPDDVDRSTAADALDIATSLCETE